jgi:ferrous iron transport protein A
MEPSPTDRLPSAMTLNELPLKWEGRIRALSARSERGGRDLPERLAELGFLPGERVRVLARAVFGDPIAVRTGSGTFALRRFEAACITVEPLPNTRGDLP